MASKSRTLRKTVNGILSDLRSSNSLRQFRGTSKVSKLLRAPQRDLDWESDQVIDAVVAAGAVPILASFLQRADDHKLRSEAANALANISAGTCENTAAVVEAGVVPIATELLSSTSSDLQDHAAWLLANIACENCRCVLEAGALPPLLALLDSIQGTTPAEQSLLKTGTWLLSNLCQYSDRFENVAECLPRLVRLIHSADEAVLKDACWGIMYLCRLDIVAVVESGAAMQLSRLLLHSTESVCLVALEAIGHISSSKDPEHSLVVIETGVLPRLRHLLHSKRSKTSIPACTAVFKIVRECDAAIEPLRESGVLDCLVDLIDTLPARDVLFREAIKCIATVLELVKPEHYATAHHLLRRGLLLALSRNLENPLLVSEQGVCPLFRIIEKLIVTAGFATYLPTDLPLSEEQQGFLALLRPQVSADRQQGSPQLAPVVYFPACPCARAMEDLGIWHGLPLHVVLQLGSDICCSCDSPIALSNTVSYISCRGLREPEVPSLFSYALRAVKKSYSTTALLRVPCLTPEVRCRLTGLDSATNERISECPQDVVTRLKSAAMACFLRGKFEEAISQYTHAIDLAEAHRMEAMTITLLLNRVAAKLKLKLYEEVIGDCSRALDIIPGHVQCLQRRAAAYEKLRLFDLALNDLRSLTGDEAEVQKHRLAELASQRGEHSTTTATASQVPGPIAAATHSLAVRGGPVRRDFSVALKALRFAVESLLRGDDDVDLPLPLKAEPPSGPPAR
eukprot:m.47189 g.47189  ORF g.47189 m.47189 type:complete len:740 (-) comp6343_c0_seq2:145-2364(-)